MAPDRAMSNSYTDERRYRGPETSRQGDRDRPQPPRRDSRDSRDNRYLPKYKDTASPHEDRHPRDYRRDNEPRPLRVDTKPSNQEGSKRKAFNSPAGNIEKSAEELRIKPITTEKPVTTHSPNGSHLTTKTPKAKNPELDEPFSKIYQFGEIFMKRVLLDIRQNKAAQETTQRRLETEKFLAKAPAYPPYQGLGNKSNGPSGVLDDQRKAVDTDYLRELEQLVSYLPASSANQAAVSLQDPATTALEARVDQLSNLIANQTEQIKTLLKENEKTRNSVTSLEHSLNDLHVKYNALASDNAELRSKSGSSGVALDNLQSQFAKLEADYGSSKEQWKEVESKTEQYREQSEAQVTRLEKASSDTSNSRKAAESSLEERVTGLEAKLESFRDYDDIKDKLDELDLITLNEICDAWVSTEYNMKTQYEEYTQRNRQGDLSVDDTLRSLRNEVDALRTAQANVAQSSNEASLPHQALIDHIDARVVATAESIDNRNREFYEKRDDEYGQMIDQANERIDALKSEISKYAEVESRLRYLEQNGNLSLSERVAILEGNGSGHRVDRVDLKVDEVNRKVEALKAEVDAQLQHSLASQNITPAMVDEIKALLLKYQAIEDAVKSLNVQFQNVSTKALAEQVVRHIGPLSGVEQRLGRLEAKMNGNEKQIKIQAEQIGSILPRLRPVGPGDKRTASPANSDEPSKKRRVEVNGPTIPRAPSNEQH